MADFAFKPPLQGMPQPTGGPKPPVVPIPTPVDAASPDSLGLAAKPKVM